LLSAQAYRCVATLLNAVFRFVPISATDTMMTSAIKAAIKPYSIAVTPSSFFRNLLIFSRLLSPFRGS